MNVRRVFALAGGLSIAAVVTIAGANAGAGSLDEKAAMEARAETARVRSLAEPRPPKQSERAPDAAAEPAWRNGIIQSGLAPVPATLYVITNQWHQIVRGEHLNVYAGAFRGDTRRGVVIVETTRLDLNGPGSPGGVYTLPGGGGPVRIVSADGTRLTLRSDDATMFVFDALERSVRRV